MPAITAYPTDTLAALQASVTQLHGVVMQIREHDPEWSIPPEEMTHIQAGMLELRAAREHLAWTSYVLGEVTGNDLAQHREFVATVSLLISQKYDSLTTTLDQIQEITA